MEFVTFLPLQVKSCRLSHLSASLKWLWHPLGHVSLKLIFFYFFFFKDLSSSLKGVSWQPAGPAAPRGASMSNRHPRKPKPSCQPFSLIFISFFNKEMLNKRAVDNLPLTSSPLLGTRGHCPSHSTYGFQRTVQIIHCNVSKTLKKTQKIRQVVTGKERQDAKGVYLR